MFTKSLIYVFLSSLVKIPHRGDSTLCVYVFIDLYNSRDHYGNADFLGDVGDYNQ